MKKSKMIKKIATVFLTGALITTAAPNLVPYNVFAAEAKTIVTQQGTVKLVAEDIQAFAEAFFSREKLAAWDVPGAIVSVVQNNEILYQQGFGVADVTANTSVRANETKFRVGSVAKVVTATALMQLIEQEKVALDEDINTYLPEPWFTYSEENPVTIAHLLTHTTGFEGGMDIRPGDLYYTLDEYYDLESYIKASIPAVVRTPGEAFKYDNFASMLQGYIVEYVSKQSFEEYVQEHIFAPLGMGNSGFRVTSEATTNMATGYLPGGQAMPQFAVKPSDLPQGGWYTTAEDAAIFMMAHLNGGTYEGKSILKPETAKMMQEHQVYIQPEVPVMAYGFEASMYPQFDRGQRIIAKGGDTLGFSSYMWLIPEHNIGVFVSVNGSNGLVREGFYRDFMEEFLPDLRVKKEALRTSVDEMKKFEGTYVDLRLENWKSKLTATENGVLTMEDALLGSITFTQIGPMTFVDANGTELVFKNNDNGEPYYFKYKNVGYSTKVNDQMYADVPSDHPYATYIMDLNNFNIFKEIKDSFRPQENITRAEFVAYFIRLLKLPLSNNASIFTDIEGHVMEREVQTAAELGLVRGVAKGVFSPDQALTRQEAAVIIYRLMQLQGAGIAPVAQLNESPANWASDAVNMMMLVGFFGPEVTQAGGIWSYRPYDAMLRQEAAAMLAKIVQIPQQSN